MPGKNKKADGIEKTKKRRTIFYLDAPDAGEVFLVGDFNGWDMRKQPMKKEENGIWKKITFLLPGIYEYKFLVDGQWQMDPAEERMCWNRFGTQNNFVVVEAS